jgi:hypothetical protein
MTDGPYRGKGTPSHNPFITEEPVVPVGRCRICNGKADLPIPTNAGPICNPCLALAAYRSDSLPDPVCAICGDRATQPVHMHDSGARLCTRCWGKHYNSQLALRQ